MKIVKKIDLWGIHCCSQKNWLGNTKWFFIRKWKIMINLESSRWKCNYTTDRKYRTSGFEYFVKSGFEREPLMLDKQMIPHFKGIDVGVKICQEQLCSFIRVDHATFLVKNTLFKEEVAWQPLKELESCSPSILELLSRAFI